MTKTDEEIWKKKRKKLTPVSFSTKEAWIAIRDKEVLECMKLARESQMEKATKAGLELFELCKEELATDQEKEIERLKDEIERLVKTGCTYCEDLEQKNKKLTDALTRLPCLFPKKCNSELLCSNCDVRKKALETEGDK